jgi:hypothetical protein
LSTSYSGESVFRTTTRPIHKLVLVIPVEEQGPEVGKTEEPPAPTRDKAAEVPTAGICEVSSQAARQTEPEVGQGESPAKAGSPPPQVEVGAPQAASDPKKKVIKQTQTVTVTTPKEEAAIADMRTSPRKRGRPRKNPVVDPPDPHKGSVLYPEKGMCADPVDKGTILGEGGGSPTAVIMSVS